MGASARWGSLDIPGVTSQGQRSSDTARGPLGWLPHASCPPRHRPPPLSLHQEVVLPKQDTHAAWLSLRHSAFSPSTRPGARNTYSHTFTLMLAKSQGQHRGQRGRWPRRKHQKRETQTSPVRPQARGRVLEAPALRGHGVAEGPEPTAPHLRGLPRPHWGGHLVRTSLGPPGVPQPVAPAAVG